MTHEFRHRRPSAPLGVPKKSRRTMSVCAETYVRMRWLSFQLEVPMSRVLETVLNAACDRYEIPTPTRVQALREIGAL